MRPGKANKTPLRKRARLASDLSELDQGLNQTLCESWYSPRLDGANPVHRGESMNDFLAKLDRLLDWFIPDDLQRNRDRRQRARMFLLSHIFGPFLGNCLPVFLYFSGFHDYRLLVLAGPITLFWVFPFLLKWWGNYTTLALLSLQNLNMLILCGCFVYGGMNSPFLPWAVTIPLLGFFYLSPAGPMKFLIPGLSAANLGLFAIIFSMGFELPETDLVALQGAGIVSTICASAYVAMMALYYANILASQVDLEHEVQSHKATAAELKRTAAIAERAGTAKSEFVANMSHELRTPLNAIIGYSEMLLEDLQADNDDPQLCEDIDRIHGAGARLLMLVNNILDYSKIEAGRQDVLPETVSLESVLGELALGHTEAAAARGNRIEFRTVGTLEQGRLDWSLASKALDNVLNNAVKFTENGRIEVVAARADEMLVVSIRDEGAGIPAEQLVNIFDTFSGGDDQSASKYGGSGVGLALTERICRLLGGTISVSSTLGAGSEFTIQLPLSPTTEAVAA